MKILLCKDITCEIGFNEITSFFAFSPRPITMQIFVCNKSRYRKIFNYKGRPRKAPHCELHVLQRVTLMARPEERDVASLFPLQSFSLQHRGIHRRTLQVLVPQRL